jgi:hypothetical protein
MIANAIARAPTAHVILFLLTDYLETRLHAMGRARLPSELCRFPIAGGADVRSRSRSIRRLVTEARPGSAERMIAEEASHVLAAARVRLVVLERRSRAAWRSCLAAWATRGRLAGRPRHQHQAD